MDSRLELIIHCTWCGVAKRRTLSIRFL